MSQAFSCFGAAALRKHLSLPILSILLCVLAGPGNAAQTNAKNVLVLFSFFDRSHVSLDLMESSLRAHVPWPVNFSISYLENPRFEEEPYRESLAETFRQQYLGVNPDLVIVASEPALRFAVQYRDKMFPGVPIVFWAISTALAHEKMSGVTGVATPNGTRGTIDLALRLHPDTTAVAVITGESQTERVWLADVHTELLRYRGKVGEIDVIGPPSSQMLQNIAALPPHTVALFQLFPQDSTQPPITSWDVLALTTQRLPTYSIFRTLALDHGGIGGAYYDAKHESVLAGEVAARVLRGEKPDNIPVVSVSNLQVEVDWRQLQHWHIQESALPPGSVVLYREPSLWESYRRYILAGIALIVAQALLIIGLLWQRARKRKAEAILRESEERFQVMADTTPSLVWMCDPHGKITYLNERRIQFTGSDSKAGYGESWIEYVHPDDVQRMLNTLSYALKTRQSFSQEYRLRGIDGVYRWMFDVASPRLNGDGSFAGFIGSAIDTTDQKLAQQALERLGGQLIEAQEQERSRIARELHDDVCQRLALLSMKIEQANLASNESPETKQDLEEIGELCCEIGCDVQSLSHQLHSSILDCLGIGTAIREFCDEISRQYEVTIEFTERDVSKHTPKDISLCLFRVAQEALHNAVKYSGTNHFTVELTGMADAIQLEVADRGAGFEVEEAKKNGGLGLMSMQERMHLAHGTLSVESTPGEGTTILAVVPLPAASRASSVSAEDDRIPRVKEVA